MTKIVLRSAVAGMVAGFSLPVALALSAVWERTDNPHKIQEKSSVFKVAAVTRTAKTEHSAEVKRLLAAVRDKGERELNLTWSETVLGGSEGAKKLEILFNQMYGTQIKINFTPGPSMTDVAGKLTQEVTAGQKGSADLFLGTEQHFGALLNRNVLEEYDYTMLSPRITKRLVIPRNLGIEICTSISVIAYNTSMIPPAEAPRKLEDVLNPKWKGKIASSQNASIFERIAMRPEWNAEKMKVFISKLSKNVGGLIRTTETERVVSGEFILLVMGAGAQHVRLLQTKGAPVGQVIPEDGGTVSFIHLGVPRNAIHPNLGKLFVNTVMSEAGQRLIYDVYFTDHHELPGSQSAVLLTDLKAKGVDLLRIDVEFVSEHPEMEKLRLELVKILREKSGT